MTPQNRQRLIIYAIGVVLGCVVLTFMPRSKPDRSERPWLDNPAPEGVYPLVLTDAYNRVVTLDNMPWRIVSLAPSITETLFAIGEERRLVGRTDWCRRPAGVSEIPSIGAIDKPNLELVAAIRPQLILASNLTGRDVIDSLERIGTTAFVLDQSDWETVERDIAAIGRLLSAQSGALKLVEDLRRRRAAIEERIATVRAGPRKRVLILYDLEALYSAGKDTWPGDLVEMVHGRNLADAAPSSWPQLNRESVIRDDPEVILLPEEKPLPDRKIREQRIVQQLRSDSRWDTVTAVREGRVAIIDDNLLSVPGPRMAEALERVAAAVRPDLFPEDP